MLHNNVGVSRNDLKRIFDIYYDSLVLFANRFLPLREECEDVVQEVFVGLWQKKRIFSNDALLKAYLYKVTRNKCYNIIKHKKVKGKYVNEALKSIEDDNTFFQQILEEEIVRELYHTIKVLPKRKQEVIKLCLKGLKNNEIAERLGIKLQTVKTLKSQAYKILRDQFKELDTILYFLLFK